MGVYRAAAIPIIVLFLVASLVGHNTGRLREIPIVGGAWDDLTTDLIGAVYDTTGIYLGVIGTADKSVSSAIWNHMYDYSLANVQNKTSYVYPYWSYTSFPRDKLPQILQSKTVQDFVNSVIDEAQRRLEGTNIPPNQYLRYLRGTAYEIMVERVKYCEGGPTKDPRYVVTHCGDCDDWHIVAYAIISKINEEHGVKADYFLTMVPGHAFLTVYYPEQHVWELYDWFPPIGRIKLPKGTPRYVDLDGYCPTLLHVPKSSCTPEIREFKSFGEMEMFYTTYGYLGEPFEYLFQLPSLRYVSGKEIKNLQSG